VALVAGRDRLRHGAAFERHIRNRPMMIGPLHRMGVPIMFEALFTYRKVLARHEAGAAAAERERYLVHRAGDEGIARATLLRITRETLVVAKWMDLGHDKSVSPQDIEAAAQKCALHQQRCHRSGDGRWSRRLFVDTATGGLRFLGRLAEPSRDGVDAFAHEVEDFAAHLLLERGLAPTTVQNRRWHGETALQANTVPVVVSSSGCFQAGC
jgi:hypothetical protein